MSRNPKIEKILQAWWEFDHCAPKEKKAFDQRLTSLIEQALGGAPYTKDQVLNYLHSQYLDFRKQKKASEKVSVAQSVLGKSP